jgi:hypothetical protein
MVASRLSGFALDVLAAVLAAVFLVFAVPQALHRAANLLISEYYLTGETLAASRARFYGDDSLRAIDQIRAQLPLDEPYLLVEGGGQKSGGVYWVRYDLAPRTSAYLGRLDEIGPGSVRRAAGSLRRVVVSYGPDRPPRLYTRHDFLEALESGAAMQGAPASTSTVPP